VRADPDENLLRATSDDFSTSQQYSSKQKGAPIQWVGGTDVPAGAIGYIVQKPTWYCRIFRAKKKFWKCVKGPHREGMTLGQHEDTVMLDRGNDTFTERFVVRSEKGIGFPLRIHFDLFIEEGATEEEFEQNIRTIVEKYGGPNWYRSKIQETLRTIVRQRVGEVRDEDENLNPEALFKPENQQILVDNIKLDLEAYFANPKNKEDGEAEPLPFGIDKVNFGGFQKDPQLLAIDKEEEVAAKRIEMEKNNAKKEEEAEEAKYSLAETQRKRLVYEAETKAMAMEAEAAGITNAQLMQDYLNALTKSPNTKIIMIPVGEDGLPNIKIGEELLNKEIPQKVEQ